MKTNKNNEATASAATTVANVIETATSTEEVKNTEKSKKDKKLKKVKKEGKVSKKEKKSKKEATVNETANAQKVSLKEEVIAHREVKYIYPEDVNDTISRKAWRAKVRATLARLERDMYRIKDQDSKEFKKAQKAYNEYRATVLKVA